MPTISVGITGRKPSRDREVEHDMPSARRVPILMTLIAELDRRFGNKFFGDGADTGGKVTGV